MNKSRFATREAAHNSEPYVRHSSAESPLLGVDEGIWGQSYLDKKAIQDGVNEYDD